MLVYTLVALLFIILICDFILNLFKFFTSDKVFRFEIVFPQKLPDVQLDIYSSNKDNTHKVNKDEFSSYLNSAKLELKNKDSFGRKA